MLTPNQNVLVVGGNGAQAAAVVKGNPPMHCSALLCIVSHTFPNIPPALAISESSHVKIFTRSIHSPIELSRRPLYNVFLTPLPPAIPKLPSAPLFTISTPASSTPTGLPLAKRPRSTGEFAFSRSQPNTTSNISSGQV